jgi:sulfate adenylyltransferase
MPDKILDERELCDLECLLNGSFAPLTTYMGQSDYSDCLTKCSYPISITLSANAAVGDVLTLKTPTQLPVARLTVREVWDAELATEHDAVLGTTDANHPYIQYHTQKYKGATTVKYVAGDLEQLQTIPHYSATEYRKTPAEMRALWAASGGPIVGFQTRNPLHNSHIQLTKNSLAAAAAEATPTLFLQPIVGVTQECDVPFHIRLRCYQHALTAYKTEKVVLGVLPLSMRMAGPREAVWHAMIRKAYGCTHFVVGRDHAGPSYRTAEGKPFYDPYDAQRLAKSLEDWIGLKIICSEELCYVPELQSYVTASEAAGKKVQNISGTDLRNMLVAQQPVPAWYTMPEIATTLSNYYKTGKGVCYYFVGLSGSGKTTLAEALQERLQEMNPYTPITVLDADIVRQHLSKGLGFSAEDRSTNVQRIGYVASEIVKHGGICIVANIAPYEKDRQVNRRLISQGGRYVEVFVDTTLELCEERDVKGLYKAARAGTLKNFTGISDPFERPQSPEVCVKWGESISSTLDRVLNV